MSASGITPVTVLTGFLGSGKTTLLARILRQPQYADTAVVVNEWGEVALDHALLREATDTAVALPSGCLCCRVAGDLVVALRELHGARWPSGGATFRRVVIETSGLADPGPILATLNELPLVAARYAVAGVIVTVDAEHGPAQLQAHREARGQVAVADRLVITKADRVDASRLAAVERAVRALNPAAPIRQAAPSQPLPQDLLDAGLYRGPSARADATGWLRAAAYRPIDPARPHAPDIASFAWSAEEPLDAASLERALRALVESAGARLLRMKGLVAVRGESGPRAIHAVGHTLYPSARLGRWPDESRASRIVFIGRGLEEGRIVSILGSLRSH